MPDPNQQQEPVQEPAVQQDQSAQTQDQQPAQQQSVPMERFNEVNQKMQQLKEQNEMMQQQVLLYQNNARQPSQQAQQQTPNLLDSIADDDIVEGKQFKQVAADFQKTIAQQLAEIRLAQDYPDMQQVIQTHLPNILKTKPHLAQALRSPQGMAVLLYELAKTDPNYQAPGSQQQAAQATQAAIDAANRPASASEAGGATVNPAQGPPPGLTDAQFDAWMKERGH